MRLRKRIIKWVTRDAIGDKRTKEFLAGVVSIRWNQIYPNLMLTNKKLKELEQKYGTDAPDEPRESV